MTHLAQIPSFLLSPRDAANLRLQNQAHVFIIPRKLLEKIGFYESDLSFEMTFEDGVLSLKKVISSETVVSSEEETL